LFDIWRDDAHVTETSCRFREVHNSGAVNAVIVADQDSHFHTLTTYIGLFLAE
jgi:hypothetical protein